MPLGRPHLLVLLLAGSLMPGCAKKHLTISPEQLPLASQHLQLAEEAVDEAEHLQLRGRYRRAERLLERADVDAQLRGMGVTPGAQ